MSGLRAFPKALPPLFHNALLFFLGGSSGFTGLEIPSWFMASAFHLSPGKSLAV